MTWRPEYVEQIVVSVLGIADQHELASQIRRGTSLYRLLASKEPDLVRSIRLMAQLSNDDFRRKLTTENVVRAIVSRRPDLEATLRTPQGMRWLSGNLKEVKRALGLA